MGVSEAIAEATLARARGRRVTAVRVRVGGGHALNAGSLDQWFQMAVDGTVAEGATVDVVVDPLRVRCAGCGNEESAADPVMTVACPRCGGVDVELSGTEQIVLESITVEAPGEE
jgi:hydrogenase nickel incorporation protein HypA/HybF